MPEQDDTLNTLAGSYQLVRDDTGDASKQPSQEYRNFEVGQV